MTKDSTTNQLSTKLSEAVEKAIASGLSDEQIATAINIGQARQEARQESRSAKNPYKRPPAVPSYVEDIINKVSGIKPADKEYFIGHRPTDEDAMIEAVLSRKNIVSTALDMAAERCSEDRLKRFADSIFNDGLDIATIKKIAALDTAPTTSNAVADILETAGVEFPTVDDAFGVASVARAILRHIMLNHKGELPYADTVTPFIAWRVKERIAEGLLKSERKLVSLKGYDSTKQMDEFDASFGKTDIVLWNVDIWNAATRKCEIFADTVVDQTLLDAASPMFWQFERKFDLPADLRFDLNLGAYYCAGFAILPHAEEHVKVTFEGKDVNVKHRQDEHYDIVDIKDTKGAREALKEAHQSLKFLRHGIGVSVIFLPLEGDDPPEVRYLKPIYEDDIIFPDEKFQQMILAALQFLTLEYVSKDEAKISKKELKDDRHLFKQVRRGKVQIPPIKIINLRRAARKPVERVERDPNKPKREWSCHWFVEPHWHKYFHKSQGRWIRHYLLTYPKGNLNAPLKPPREKVFKAIR
jgi:hypothetical protein